MAGVSSRSLAKTSSCPAGWVNSWPARLKIAVPLPGRAIVQRIHRRETPVTDERSSTLFRLTVANTVLLVVLVGLGLVEVFGPEDESPVATSQSVGDPVPTVGDPVPGAATPSVAEPGVAVPPPRAPVAVKLIDLSGQQQALADWFGASIEELEKGVEGGLEGVESLPSEGTVGSCVQAGDVTSAHCAEAIEAMRQTYEDAGMDFEPPVAG